MARNLFIHIADPGFPEPPWPGARLLGPFTKREAIEQAAADIAIGAISPDSFLGIFNTRTTSTRKDSNAGGAEAVDRALIEARADELRQEQAKHIARQHVETREALERILPVGVPVDDVLELVRGIG